jgi:hypothetical protein
MDTEIERANGTETERAASKRSLRRARAKRRKALAAFLKKERVSRRSLPAARRRKQSKTESPAAQFAAARELLKQMMQSPEIHEMFDPHMRSNSRMIYTKGLTLWMLTLQRLCNGLSLESTVSHILHHDRDLLPDNKRVREGTLSQNSSAYHTARQNLSLDSVYEFSSAVCDYLGRSGEPAFDGRRVFVIDGTTITLAPTAELKAAFPPAPNQHGESVWPVAMLMVAHEMRSGCALLPQLDPMYGPHRSSEAAQAKQIVTRLPARSIVMADAGFGIFSVAYHSTQAGHDILFRLTASRFRSLRRQARLLEEGSSHKSYVLDWQPSAKDRQSNPHLPDDAEIRVVVHEVELENGGSLYLVSTLEIDAITAAHLLYQHRYEVEFDIRDLKVTMDAENILAKSVDMVKKELLASVIAFNLVMQFRRQASKLAHLEPRRLSFTGVWLSFRDHLLLKEPATLSEWQDLYAAALISASQRKLPNRSKPRSYPRKAHPRRPKSTKFMKQPNHKNSESPPPLVLK